MNASDVMVRNVVTVGPDDDVAAAVRLLVDHDISAVSVVDAAGRVVGILSEADLLHREEDGTLKRRSWWVEALTPSSTLALDYAKMAWPQGGGGHVKRGDFRQRGRLPCGDRQSSGKAPDQTRADPQGWQARRNRQPL